MKILVAEDDPASHRILVGTLERRGDEVQPVYDGAAAWEALQRRDAARLAILDWMMPGIERHSIRGTTETARAGRRRPGRRGSGQ